MHARLRLGTQIDILVLGHCMLMEDYCVLAVDNATHNDAYPTDAALRA